MTDRFLSLLKMYAMSIAELQLHLHQAIDEITDVKKLELIHALLQKDQDRSKRLTLAEYQALIDAARADFNRGDFSSAEDFEKEAKAW
jgi:hypothetical protein